MGGPDGRNLWALLPAELIEEAAAGDREVEVYAVTGPPDAPRFRPLTTELR
jgi:hypothetical protein